MPQTILNDELLRMARDLQAKEAAARRKMAFVDAATAGGQAAGGAPPPAGGAPPTGGDPAAAGAPPGGPPMAPPPEGPPPGGAAPSSGPDPFSMVMQRLDAIEQKMHGGGAPGAAGGAGLKPKIDQNVELMQMKNLLARIADTIGIQIPAQEMVATPEKLRAMAGQQGSDPSGAPTAGAAAGGGSAIQPIQPIQGASPEMAAAKQGSYLGTAYVAPQARQQDFHKQSEKAAALLAILRRAARG